MPYSDITNRPWVCEKLQSIEKTPLTVLDVGAGAGAYLDILRGIYGNSIYVTAAEVWEPYLYKFQLLHRYDAVALGDIRERTNFTYDLVILGDVLEHMNKDEAIELWRKISEQANYALIGIPIIHYPQGAEHNNPYEEHVKDDWTVDEVLQTFPGIVDWQASNITGAFLAQFE